MNPRQRRGVVLLVLAAVGALGVFVAVSSYVGNIQSQVGPMATVLRVNTDVEAYKPVTEGVLERVSMPRRWVPQKALGQPLEALGKVAAADLPKGSVLQVGMLVPPPALEQGQREVAILVDAETGVAGKIAPGGVVDIYATFDGGEHRPPRSEIIVTGARIIDVGAPTTEAKKVEEGGFGESKVVPVTFALSVKDSLVLTYAESFSTKVRLGLVPGGDDEPIPVDERNFELGAEGR